MPIKICCKHKIIDFIKIEPILSYAIIQFEFDFKSDGASESANLADPWGILYDHISTEKDENSSQLSRCAHFQSSKREILKDCKCRLIRVLSCTQRYLQHWANEEAKRNEIPFQSAISHILPKIAEIATIYRRGLNLRRRQSIRWLKRLC